MTDEGSAVPKQPRLVTYECKGITFVIPDRYVLTGIVGRGAYGIVASCQDKVTGHKVAVKKVIDVFSKQKELQKRILREVLILEHLRNHENITCMTDIGFPPTFASYEDVYIFMEFMHCDLRSLIKSPQNFTNENVQYFMYQLLRGLKFMHSADIVHRDLKPSNILLNADFEVKLCDFGLSRGIDFTTDPTMSTNYVATRWYRAPELLLMWDKASKAMDVWSLGCILAELLDTPTPKRRALFPGQNYLNQLELILDVCGTPTDIDAVKGCTKAKLWLKRRRPRRPRRLRRMFPAASDEAIDLLGKMLEFDPDARITVDDALNHPFLSQMREEGEVEPTCDPFDFRTPDEMMAEEDDDAIKRALFNFSREWGAKCHGFAGENDPIVDETIIHVEVEDDD